MPGPPAEDGAERDAGEQSQDAVAQRDGGAGEAAPLCTNQAAPAAVPVTKPSQARLARSRRTNGQRRGEGGMIGAVSHTGAPAEDD